MPWPNFFEEPLTISFQGIYRAKHKDKLQLQVSMPRCLGRTSSRSGWHVRGSIERNTKTKLCRPCSLRTHFRGSIDIVRQKQQLIFAVLWTSFNIKPLCCASPNFSTSRLASQVTRHFREAIERDAKFIFVVSWDKLQDQAVVAVPRPSFFVDSPHMFAHSSPQDFRW